MKTALQQGLDELQAEIDKWDIPFSPVRGALLCAREIFKSLLPTERQIIEDAYNAGRFDAAWSYIRNSTVYFNQNFNDKNDNDATN